MVAVPNYTLFLNSTKACSVISLQLWKTAFRKVWNLKQFWVTLVIFELLKIWSISGVPWWTLHHWHDLWIISWLHIINWHSIIYQELVSSYTLFQFRDTPSVIHVKEEKSSIRFVLLSKYSTHALHTIYSGKEYHSFHWVPLHGSLLVPLSFMGIKMWHFFFKHVFFIFQVHQNLLQSCLRHCEC
jgi:hypothetical protein